MDAGMPTIIDQPRASSCYCFRYTRHLAHLFPYKRRSGQKCINLLNFGESVRSLLSGEIRHDLVASVPCLGSRVLTSLNGDRTSEPRHENEPLSPSFMRRGRPSSVA